MKGNGTVKMLVNVGKAAVYGVLFGILAGLMAAWWDKGPDAIWPSQEPVLFGVAVGLGCLVVAFLLFMFTPTRPAWSRVRRSPASRP
jgi:hypothetical protein